MLVAARFTDTGPGSGPAIPDCAQAELKCLGNLSDSRRFRRNLLAAAAPRSWHRQERKYQADRPAAGRPEHDREPTSPERRGPQRHQALQLTSEGAIRRNAVSDRREIRDNADGSAGPNTH